MLDQKFLRENPQLVKKAIAAKNEKAKLDQILALDKKKRKLQFKFDNLRAEQKRKSEQIPILKREKKDVSHLITRMKTVSKESKKIAEDLKGIVSKLEKLLLTIPNIPAKDVPIGDESRNEFVREWGEKKIFDFPAKDHFTLSKEKKLLELKRAVKIAGSGFVGYCNKGALIERALINFMLDFHILKHGYMEYSLPVLVNRKTMTGTGQLPKLEEDMYHIEQDDMFLVPTAEVSLTNLFSDEILELNSLPKKFVSFSPCFRREAGSYGKDTKGLQRIHQFNKVEMVRFVEPKISYQILEEMVKDAEEILQALNLHYRVVKLASGDLSFASAKTYDLEVWAPASKKYLEVSSISNFEDFQARRSSIRYRDENGDVNFVHTLNGSGLATPRTFISLIETYQNEDGTVSIPSILQPYLNNLQLF